MKNGKKTRAKTRKYVFVVGGVMSGVGKGISASSIALLLQSRGLKVTAMKIDPYINVDAGTMNPTEHGEVFVLKGGLETDQDMGNYERFLNTDIPDENYMTTGSIYLEVIRRERNLEYQGKNVEVVPDIPLAVIEHIDKATEKADADIIIVEIGGTVGEYQNVLFLEAIRMLQSRKPDDVAVVMVSYLPVPGSIGEMKTKPTQTAVRALNSAGVFADFIIARSTHALDVKRKEKIARFCNVKAEHVISAPDVESVYDVPINFERDKISSHLCEVLNIRQSHETNLTPWKKFVSNMRKRTGDPIRIGVVGKYFATGDFILSDVYVSVLEALKYSSAKIGSQMEIRYISSPDLEKKGGCDILEGLDGILVPGGFGKTGVEGIKNAIEYARVNKIPYFGICYGMQLAVISYAERALGMKGSDTEELNPRAKHLIIGTMEAQRTLIAKKQMGGTMRLGEYQAVLQKGSVIAKAYGTETINERHRHRYEVNNAYIETLTKGGLIFGGTSPDGMLMETIELPAEKHPFFVGVQYHPEFHARPLSPHPLFTAFIGAAKNHKTSR